MIKESSQGSRTIEVQRQKTGLTKHNQSRATEKQNQLLKKQLQVISTRLDQQIKKRMDKQRRPWSRNSDEGSYMQLQNAYKKCQIYKKQANFFKKRLSTFQDESKHSQNDNKMQQYIKQNAELKNEIKSLNKLIKSHEKALIQMSSQDNAKILRENEKLKEENRRLKKSLSEYRLSSLNIKQPHRESEENQNTDSQLNNKDEQKMQKMFIKLKILTKQNGHLRDLNQNYRYQLQQKQKQLNVLREKIGNLRRNNEQLLSQVTRRRNQKQPTAQQYYRQSRNVPAASRANVKSQVETSRKEQSHHSNVKLKSKAEIKRLKLQSSNKRQNIQQYKIQPFKNQQALSSQKSLEDQKQRSDIPPPNKRVWKAGQKLSKNQNNQLNNKEKETEQKDKQNNIQTKENKQDYRNTVKENIDSIKWNDQAFNSKIKSIEVIIDEDKNIKDIHAEYAKGGPKKFKHANQKYKSIVLTCSEHEHITIISGIFQHGYLQFLSLTTSNKRREQFGKEFLENKDQIEPFQFQADTGLAIGALHGQKNEQGITKIGYIAFKL